MDSWYLDHATLIASFPDQGADPETLEWCSFDNEYRKKLDRSPYVSLSLEKRVAEEALLKQDANIVEKGLEPRESLKSGHPDGTKLPTDASVPDDADYEFDTEASDEDTEIPEGSLFDYNMPGVLKAEEVARLDLDHWKLLVRNMLIDFEVR